MSSSRSLLGLDLSLRAAAAVAVPSDWDGDFRRVQSYIVGEPLSKQATDAERAQRTDRISKRIVMFAKQHGAQLAMIEGYAFGAKTGREALGELGGVVKLALVNAGLEIRTVPVASARKLLLGTVPRSKPKDAVREALKAAGAPASWSADEMDAFTVANWGLSEVGGYCFAVGEAA